MTNLHNVTTHDERELAGCENGGYHDPEWNEHSDAWCHKCGERLLLTGSAGGPNCHRAFGSNWCTTHDEPWPMLANRCGRFPV